MIKIKHPEIIGEQMKQKKNREKDYKKRVLLKKFSHLIILVAGGCISPPATFNLLYRHSNLRLIPLDDQIISLKPYCMLLNGSVQCFCRHFYFQHIFVFVLII